MEEKRIKEIQQKADKLLREQRLKQALETMGEEIETMNNWELRTHYTEMQTAYNYMLEYMSKGMPDPDRSQLHKRLIGKAYLFNDEIAATRLAEHSISVYSQMRRKYKNDCAIAQYHEKLREQSMNMALMRMMPTDNATAIQELSKRHEQESGELFMRIWSSGAWSRSQQQEAESMLNDFEVDINDKALMISAITISLFKIFDPTKAILLTQAATHEEPAIAQRALIGLLMVLFTGCHRIQYYPELQKSIETLSETTGFERRLLVAQIQLLRSRETQKIDRKMREEIIPAMLKNPNLRNNKLGIDLEKDILDQQDKNPEWEEWLEADGIKNKLDEMAQWQTEGADVYMSTFSHLKHYPFFNEMPNWFRLFDINSPTFSSIIPTEESKKNLMKTLFASKFFCNSDKYSFCFTLQQIPEEQRNMMAQQLREQHGDGTLTPDTEIPSIPRKVEEELQGNQYIQDLYRFFKLSSFRIEFIDPFGLSLNLLEKQETATLLQNPESHLRIFRHLMQKEYYSEAATIGTLIEKSGTEENSDAQFHQEMGYCKQQAGDYDAAIEYYQKADIIKPDTLWTIRHIAQCHRMKRNPKGALPYYLQAEELAPDNRAILLQTGECLVALKRYDEAFSRFFKAEYNAPQSKRAWRAIAWCSFMVDNHDRARTYYEKLLATPERTMQDWLNAAHVELVTHNNGKAIEYYRKAAVLCKDDEEFSSNLMADSKILAAKGISINDLILVRDIVS